jgi:hypothetical protein
MCVSFGVQVMYPDPCFVYVWAEFSEVPEATSTSDESALANAEEEVAKFEQYEREVDRQDWADADGLPREKGVGAVGGVEAVEAVGVVV